MLCLSILDHEKEAKELLFALTTKLSNNEWRIVYVDKISALARYTAQHQVDIIVFNEIYDTPRITEAFVLSKPKRIIIYVQSNLTDGMRERHPYQRIFYIDRHHIQQEITAICPFIERLLKHEDVYSFTYNNFTISLHIADIYYIEKDGKYVVYHTKRGMFKERKNMKDVAQNLAPYDFLWIHISYLVNMQYISEIQNDYLYLEKTMLPIARSRKAGISKKLHKMIE